MATNMKKASLWFLAGAVLFAISPAAPAWAAGGTTFSSIVVFGDSLSDAGNAFALTGMQSTPPYDRLDPLLIPDAPYAKGGHRFSNGPTWIEQIARQRGLAWSVRPALANDGTKAANYAVGGARAYDDGINYNLPAQVNAFLTDARGTAPSDALYVVEFGGNDLRDALASGDPGILTSSLGSVGGHIQALYMAGARKFLVWNMPDLGATPAIIMLDYANQANGAIIEMARFIENIYNQNLDAILDTLSGLPGIEIRRFDAYRIVNDMAAEPAAFGLEVVNAACVTPRNPPFDCKEPDEYLFWDGIHPTRAVHGILAQEAADVLSQ